MKIFTSLILMIFCIFALVFTTPARSVPKTENVQMVAVVPNTVRIEKATIEASYQKIRLSPLNTEYSRPLNTTLKANKKFFVPPERVKLE